MIFTDFPFPKKLQKAIEDAGFTTPSPIQEAAIPVILSGKDVIAQAKTGTGKTAAFCLPALSMMNAGAGTVELLVVAPTRELATQVSDEINRFGQALGVRSVSICGGRSYARQIEAIAQGAQVVVATPGRLLDLLESGRIPKLKPGMVVLDEADEMLDMGFLEEIQAIFEFLPEERQTILVSATMPPAIQKLAKQILKQPSFVHADPTEELSNADIAQRAYFVEERDRHLAMMRLLDAENPQKAIIFCRTRSDVDTLTQALASDGYAAAALHGDLEQRQRERVTLAFREGRIRILVATDVAARGLNVLDVSHVFNFHVPSAPEAYVHRIGRTGRAGQKGVAITLLVPSDAPKLRHIRHIVKSQIDCAQLPSLSSVKRAKLDDLLGSIAQQSVDDEALQLIAKYEDRMESEQFLPKVLSMLLAQQTVRGPERLGLSLERIEQLLLPQKRGERGSGPRDDRRGGRPRRFGDRKPRGGGSFGRPEHSDRRDDNRRSERRPEHAGQFARPERRDDNRRSERRPEHAGQFARPERRDDNRRPEQGDRRPPRDRKEGDFRPGKPSGPRPFKKHAKRG